MNGPFIQEVAADGRFTVVVGLNRNLKAGKRNNRPSTVVIDEPELGLHPFALDVLAGLLQDASQRTQLIISTQSATLLNHFEPEHVIVVDRENRASRFRRLEQETLSAWLEDYTLGELWQKNVFDGGPAHE
jgi:predicted ATPase